MPWNNRMRRAAVAVAAVLLAQTVVQAGGQLPSAAAPAPEKPISVPKSAAALTPITLITGDVVGYLGQPGGKDTVQVLKSRPGVRFQFLNTPNGWYAIPSDAVSLIGGRTVDRELFNVSYLAKNGYADGGQATMPVLIGYGSGAARARAAAMPGAATDHVLTSIGANAVRVAKTQAGAFWKTLVPAAGKRDLASGAARIMLDRKAKATLADSVAQIGAPQAWAAGYDGKGVRVAVLDTGVDATHPDLAGKVLDGKSFVADEPDLIDRNGHGTHVASTVAGSGAASAGKEKGVAPGAGLVIGKVLNGAGLGYDSDIIAGMEWAATTEHAQVISMSLGGPVLPGDDPMVDAVNSLTASTGALFVLAAGNSGPVRASIGSPAAAVSALTVGAVDHNDRIAEFSSRGPNVDGSVKPEITAPGVGIVAARAAGTSLGTPVNDYYTTLSGTSMATPHVAGAAAILAQRHPDWTASQLKATLVAAGKDIGAPVNSQGAGRVDVPTALDQTLSAQPSTIGFGVLPAPQSGTRTSTLTYHNAGSAAITLKIAVKMTDPNGKPAPDGTLAAGASQLTVPAGGQAQLPVVLAPGKVGIGSFQGTVVAASADGKTKATTPVGFSNGPVSHTVRLKVIGFDGEVRRSSSQDMWILPVDAADTDWLGSNIPTGDVTFQLPQGKYMILTNVFGGDGPNGTEQTGLMVNPTVNLSADTEVTFDLRKTKKVQISAPQPTWSQAALASVHRKALSGVTWDYALQVGVYDPGTVYVNEMPSQPNNEFSFDYQTVLTRSQLDLTVGSVTVHPHYIVADGGNDLNVPFPVRMFDGRKNSRLVYLGAGTDADFAGKTVKGQVVLVQTDTAAGLTSSVVRRAYAAGASGLVVFDSLSMTQTTNEDRADLLPVSYLARPDGLAVLSQLTKGIEAPVRLLGTPVSPFAYHFAATRIPGIPASGLTFRVDLARMVKIDTTYQSPRDLVISSGVTVDDLPPLPSGDLLRAPSRRLDYYGPAKAGPVWGRFMEAFENGNLTLLSSGAEQMARPQSRTDVFNAAPRRPGQAVAYRPLQVGPQALSLSRTANTMFYTPQVLDGNNHWDMAAPLPGEMSVKLSQDGKTLPGAAGSASVSWPLSQSSGRYRFDVDYTPAAFTPAGYRSNTSWEFGSPTPNKAWTGAGLTCGDADNPATASQPCAAAPAIMLDYALDVRKLLVRPYQVPGASNARITGVTVEVSYDSGKTWRSLPLVALPNGQWLGLLIGQRPGTSVSLRTIASDSAGNKVTQTLLNAY
jgi:subtilisin family serine protease